MKKKASLTITILLLAIGFAAVSTTLIINGSAKIGENPDDFSVIFTAATLDGKDVYDQVISQDKKTITFETSELKTLNQTSVLNYEVTNNSANYDAEVQVNCKVKENTTAKYTSITNELENNVTKVLAKETLNGTLTVTLEKTATEEVREEYVCTLVFNAVERDELGIGSISFAEDTWEAIAKNVKAGKTDTYKVGDTKKVDLGNLGTHIVRIANMSECTNGETSETACGFVVEFADIITQGIFNSTRTNVGGWRDSKMRTYVNDTIYKSLPSDLQNVIAITKVISGHGSIETSNFETQDKLYLLSTKEVSLTMHPNDVINSETRLLDYYRNKDVKDSNTSGAIKKYNGSGSEWWLRSAVKPYNIYFFYVRSGGNWDYNSANNSSGVSPAFRIA